MEKTLLIPLISAIYGRKFSHCLIFVSDPAIDISHHEYSWLYTPKGQILKIQVTPQVSIGKYSTRKKVRQNYKLPDK